MPNENKYITLRIPAFSKTQLLVMVFLIFLSFFAGSLWTKTQYEEKIKTIADERMAAPKDPPDLQEPEAEAATAEDTSPKQVSIDDDAVLGDESAAVTFIDFTDYECPFCKQYFDQTFAQIKKDYIDTGKVKYVVRDLPLSFHANAHKEAQAAECAREQGGDGEYFKYHDEIFKRTTSNGTGLALTELAAIANDLGLDGVQLQTCLDSDKYKAEVDKDLADAASVGATGTPSFFVGKSSQDGTITGTIIVGAQPYSDFKAEIDKLL
jgi:protein-disulfide isomerase